MEVNESTSMRVDLLCAFRVWCANVVKDEAEQFIEHINRALSFKQEMKRLYPGHCEACFKLLLALSETQLICLFREQIRYFINCLLSGEKITDVILCFLIVISDKTSCLNCYFREE